MIARRIIPALMVAALFAFANSEANAQYLYGQGGFGQGGYGPYGHPYGSSLYSLGRIPVPPYFALHPPVYYSGNKTTTYGTTPFARRPRVQIDYPVHALPAPAAQSSKNLRLDAPPAQSARSTKVVRNPYIGGEPTPAEKPAMLSAQPTHTAKVIENPFVAKARLAARN